MSDSAVEIEERGDRVIIRLNRPEVKNAINTEMVDELHEVCHDLEQKPRITLLVGSGENFAAGADIRQLRDRRREHALAGINSGIFERIRRLPMPVIGLLDGYALGGGAELAYACDFRIGTPDVRIGNPEPGLGILAAAGASWRLAELVGEPCAKEILLTGRVLSAAEARELHLLNDVVKRDRLFETGNALADRIGSQGSLAVRLSKAVFHAPRAAHPFVDDLAQAVLFESEEKDARMSAFFERKNRSTS